MKLKRGKRGQLTIFIIIAIVIVAIGIFIYMVYPKIKTTIGVEEKNPPAFIQTCIEDEIKNTLEKISLQGGSVEPEFYTLYANEKVEYLCYTNEYYLHCVVQQPLLKPHIEKEIKENIENEADECFDSLKQSFEKRGYEVSLRKGIINVELLPKRVVSTFNYSLTISKTNTERYDSFSVILNNNLYELVAIANSIIESETTYGDADVTIYMSYYRDLKVEKKEQSDGSKIYIITDRNTGDKFQFASRSKVLPPGHTT